MQRENLLVVADTDYFIAEGIFCFVITADDHEPGLAVFIHQLPVLFNAGSIQVGTGFIQQYQRRIGKNALGQLHPLFHAR